MYLSQEVPTDDLRQQQRALPGQWSRSPVSPAGPSGWRLGAMLVLDEAVSPDLDTHGTTGDVSASSYIITQEAEGHLSLSESCSGISRPWSCWAASLHNTPSINEAPRGACPEGRVQRGVSGPSAVNSAPPAPQQRLLRHRMNVNYSHL